MIFQCIFRLISTGKNIKNPNICTTNVPLRYVYRLEGIIEIIIFSCFPRRWNRASERTFIAEHVSLRFEQWKQCTKFAS